MIEYIKIGGAFALLLGFGIFALFVLVAWKALHRWLAREQSDE